MVRPRRLDLRSRTTLLLELKQPQRMKLPLFFAKRYLFSKKSVNAINIISIISIVGVMVSSAALVIVLSFYNGMENFILSLYSTFAPELRIEPAEGKVFSANTVVLNHLRHDERIKSYTEVLEDKVLAQHGSRQYIGRIKGIEPPSLESHAREDMLYAGNFSVEVNGLPYAIVGAQVQSNLQLSLHDLTNTLELFSPRKSATNSINPLENVNVRRISPHGVLAYEQGFDDLIITPLQFAKDLLDEHEKVSAIEIYTTSLENLNQIQRDIQKSLGADYVVKNREQQNPTLYKTIRSEKWIVFFILTLIGIIAIFNMIGSLTMLVLDKKNDMKTLKSLGAEDLLIQRIFFLEGILIALIGSVLGIVGGYIFCKLQEIYGWVRTTEAEGSLIDIYPVDIRFNDFILVFITIIVVSSFVSYMSSKLSIKELSGLDINRI